MKNKLILKIGILILFLFLLLPSYGQNTDSTMTKIGLKRNVIYGTVGTLILYGGANLSYERMIFEPQKGFINSIWAKGSFGAWYTWGGGGPHGILGITALTGAKKHHLEFGIGYTALFDRTSYDIEVNNANHGGYAVPTKADFTDNYAAGTVGYRFQKPNKHFVFRTGVSFPESIYLSVGFCF